MIIRAAGHQLHAAVKKGLCQFGCIGHNLMLIGFEFRPECLAQCHGLGGDDMHERAALGSGEHGGIDLFGDFRVIGHDDAASGTAHGLVGGGGHHIGVGHGTLVFAGGHEACDVGDIHHQIGADLMGDLTEGLEIDGSGVGGGTGDDHPRPAFLRDGPYLVIIDASGCRIQSVGDDVVGLSGEVRFASVGQMSALIQAHAHDGISRFAEGEIDGIVCLGAAVGLDVGKLGVEDHLGALDADILRKVHIFASAVIAVARVSFGVFVREDRPHDGHDLRGNQVF